MESLPEGINLSLQTSGQDNQGMAMADNITVKPVNLLKTFTGSIFQTIRRNQELVARVIDKSLRIIIPCSIKYFQVMAFDHS